MASMSIAYSVPQKDVNKSSYKSSLYSWWLSQSFSQDGVMAGCFFGVVSAFNYFVTHSGCNPCTTNRSYDYTQSTCKNFETNELKFVGRFKKVREKMDYTYHVNYIPERQRWQDVAIGQTFPRTITVHQNLWLVYTCGAMGVGKGYVWKYITKENLEIGGISNWSDFVRVDPDYFKEKMPQWREYTKINQEAAGTLCHKESGYMAEIQLEVALQHQCMICVDGSLKCYEFYKIEIARIRLRYPMYRIAILAVYATEQIIRSRVYARGIKTGRFVPEETWMDSIVATEASLAILGPLCDCVVKIDNNTDTPRILEG